MPDAPTYVVGLDGPATVREAPEIAETLKRGLAAGDRIELSCDGLTEVDLAFIQIVLSARRSAVLAGKALHLSAPASGPLADALQSAGIQADDFWFGGRA